MDAQAQIARLKAELLAKDARIAEQEAYIAKLEALVASLTEQVARLTRQVELLTEKLEQNSKNSNRPPSSDPPGRTGRRGSRKKRSKNKSKRKRGGQPGHAGSHRALLPSEQVTEFVEVFPPQCENCWNPLPRIPEQEARRYQVIEVEPVLPTVTEYRRHAVRCSCGYTTRVPFEQSEIPTSSFGPRLMSLALLCGVAHP